MATDVWIRPIIERDREWISRLVIELWGSGRMVSRGRLYGIDKLPGFVAFLKDRCVGLLTYAEVGDECEIVSLNSLQPGYGIGTALIDTIKEHALKKGYKRVWLITTNDNLHALRFYQRRGLVLVALYRNALDQSRVLKPEIPAIGYHNIPLRDEIELELLLDAEELEEETDH